MAGPLPAEAIAQHTTTCSSSVSANTREGVGPSQEDDFASNLARATSNFARKQRETAFLLGPQVGRSKGGPALVDEQHRLLVLANAAAGYSAEPPTPALPKPEVFRAHCRPVQDKLRPAGHTDVTVGPLSQETRGGVAPGKAATHSISSPALDSPESPLPELQRPASVAASSTTAASLTAPHFPRPAGDNGRGVHWIPTLRSSPDVVDEFVEKADAMGMKWVVFLNDGTNIGDNEYLVQRLREKGIMPIMRVFTDGLQPIEGDLESMVRHYRSLGVPYYQLYNEPNLMVETHGRLPSVKEYLDLWIPAAKKVIAAGGLPGIGALSPQGEMDDRQFLSEMLQEILARGEERVLDYTWLAVHNYTGPRSIDDPDGFLRFMQYDAIIRQKLGRSMPMIGTEGGTHVGPGVDERRQVEMVLDAYRYMAQHRNSPNFAYTYWIIANEAGGGKDPEFSHHALFRKDGPTALASALMQLA